MGEDSHAESVQPPRSAEIDDIASESGEPPLSKTEASIQAFGSTSYYYAHQKREAALGPRAPVPVPTPTQLSHIEASARRPNNQQLVPREPGEDWVDPPPPGGWTLAIPAPVYTEKDLFSWTNWVSPPRGWPWSFEQSPNMKKFIASQLAGKRVRLTEPPHRMELERLAELGVVLSDSDAKANAMAVRRALGWEMVGGYALLELAQGSMRSDPVEKHVYHGERHWWNVTGKGLWIDLSPRPHHKKLVLVESAKVGVPTRTDDDEAAGAVPPADRAEEILVDYECDGVALRGVRLTDKALDGSDENMTVLEACLLGVEKPLRAARPRAPLDRSALRGLQIDGAEVSAATTTRAREVLRGRPAEPSYRPRIELSFWPNGSEEHLLLKWASLHTLRLREGTTLCLARIGETSPPISLAQLRTFASMACDLAPLAVRALHIDSNAFGDEGVEALSVAFPALSHLERLVMHSNAITDAGAATLAATALGHPVLELNLARNQITDSGLAALCEAMSEGKWRIVEALDVTENPASPKAFEETTRVWKATRRGAKIKKPAAAEEPISAK